MTSKNIISGNVTEVTTDYSAFTWTVHDFHFCNERCCEGKSITSPEFITKNISDNGQQNDENAWKLELFRKEFQSQIVKNLLNQPGTIYDLIRLSTMMENSFKILHRGHLKLLCELSTKNIKRIKIDNELESLSNDLAISFQDKNTSDVVIVVGDEKFYVHKVILMSRSSVFRAMFENDMKEKRENTVNILNFDSKVIQEMLRFIYTGKVKNINGFERILLSAADQYDLENLIIICANILCDDLKVENAYKMLALAYQYRLTHFRNEVLEFIAYNIDNIITSKFEDLVQ